MIKKEIEDGKRAKLKFKPKSGYVYVVTNECLKLVRKVSFEARWLRP